MHPDTSQNRRATVCAREADNLELLFKQQNTHCAACEQGRGCGAGLLRFSQPRTKLSISTKDWPDLKVGDSVALHLPPKALLRLSACGYGVPLLFFVVSVLLSSPWFSEFWVVIIAMIALAAGARLGGTMARRNGPELTPHIRPAADKS
ncbi:MAG: SoxR reducing system RseC family protein [Pseudomonadota bacterium]